MSLLSSRSDANRFAAIFLLYCLIADSVKDVNVQSSYCPLSSQINYELSGLLPYPDLYREGNEAVVNATKTYLCLHRPIPPMGHPSRSASDVLLKCSTNICPIRMINVQAALDFSRTYDNRASSLCNIVGDASNNGGEAVSTNKRKMQFIVLGSGMTSGHGTVGNGCCDRKLNPTCPQVSCPKYERIIHHGLDNAHSYYAWPAYFYRWLVDAFPGSDIQYLDRSINGWRSYNMAEKFHHVFHHDKVSSSDLILIDYAAKDNAVELGEEPAAFEALIRLIIRTSKDGGWPNIVIIDYCHDYIDRESSIGIVYRTVAKHYGLPLWSFCDVIKSDYAKKYQKRFLPQLIATDPRQCGDTIHPAWHVHMLLADLYAGCLQQTLQTVCRNRSRSSVSGSRKAVDDLPPVLFDQGDFASRQCDETTPLLMDARPLEDGRERKPLKFLLQGGWTEIAEDRGLTKRSKFVITANATTEAAKGLQTVSPTAEFYLALPAAFTSSSKVLFKIVYVKTYLGAGRFKLSICGDAFPGDDSNSIVDTLYGYGHPNVSLPTLHIVSVNTSYVVDACNKRLLSTGQRTRQPSLEILFIPSDDRRDSRASQNVKLIHLEACVLRGQPQRVA